MNAINLSHHQIENKMIIINICLNTNDVLKSIPLISKWMDTISNTL